MVKKMDVVITGLAILALSGLATMLVTVAAATVHNVWTISRILVDRASATT